MIKTIKVKDIPRPVQSMLFKAGVKWPIIEYTDYLNDKTDAEVINSLLFPKN